MEVTVVGLAQEVGPVVWAEVDPQEATCSKELETGNVLTRMYHWEKNVYQGGICHLRFFVLFFPLGVVVTRTLPGEWSVTSAKPPNQKV